jgi:phenylpyruvate tautomerase PptA (4-oxalocrotonate tautomerase family)
MPFIRTTTNVKVTDAAAEEIKAAYGKDIELISGKAECYLMLSITDSAVMAYQGDMKAPAAMVEVQLLGKADPAELNDFTAAASRDLNKILGIPEERIYVNYLEYEHWGVGGHNV